MDVLKRFFSQLKVFWTGLAPARRTTFLTILILAIVGGTVFFTWIKKINYSPLYSNLDAQEAGEVISKLKEYKISYQLANNGSAIAVPSAEVYETRLRLATEGLPRSGSIGYEIFDKNNLGMTDFLQKINYRRALEGELTKTIMQLKEVLSARVHLAIPEQRLFEEDKQEPKASIVLKLNPARPLNQNQVQGITHLVASSVEGLKPSNITIVDSQGNLLSSGSETDPNVLLSSTQLDLKRNAENYLQNKAQTLLDGVLGKNKSLVRVNTELNFEQAERTIEEYDPEKVAIRSEERNTESSNDSDKDANQKGKESASSKENVVTNYEVSKTSEHIITAMGTIQKLSVALILDGTYNVTTGKDGKKEKQFVPRSQEELSHFANMVKNAVGFDSTRADKIEVSCLAFDNTALEEEQVQLEKIEKKEMYFSIGKKVGLVLALILGFFFLRILIRKMSKGISNLKTYASPSPDSFPPFSEKGYLGEGKRPLLAEQLANQAKNKPEEMAKIIKTMMVE
jgi:flagellar M-ring protein FliF